MGDKSKKSRYKNISKIIREIVLYSICVAIVCWVASLPILGIGITFPYGLALGVAVAIVNLNVLGKTVEATVARRKKGPMTIGLIVRILLYGGALAVAARTSTESGVGAAIGFLLPRVVMYGRYGLMPRIRKALGKEPEAVYVTDTASNVFVKEPRFVQYYKGRAYLTHRHYRKIRIVPETPGPVKRRNGKLK